VADPLYRRIADDLRAQIETGQLEPGSQLPPEEKLGEAFDASRNAIRDAIKFLINLGLVETRAGQGTFVVDPSDPLVTTLTTHEPGLGGGEGAAYLTEASKRHPRSTIPPSNSRPPWARSRSGSGGPGRHAGGEPSRAAFHPGQARQSADRFG
jgi:DNA-binding transcriptional MocR family regulator